MQTLCLKSQRLLLRSHTAEDVEPIVVLANDPAIGLMMNLPYPYTEKDARRWINNPNKLFDTGRRISFAIVLLETQQMIGIISLSIDKKKNEAELGYWLGRDYWRQGYATEAANCVVSYAFKQLKLASLFAEMIVTNEASDRVLLKIGMDRKTICLQAIKRFGHTYDKYIYCMQNPDMDKVVKAD